MKISDCFRQMQENHLKAVRQMQENCSHCKGGRHRGRCTIKDYILTHHRFIDGSERVWCQLCKKEFDPQASETKRMLEESTNRMSSSEIPIPKKETRQRRFNRLFFEFLGPEPKNAGYWDIESYVKWQMLSPTEYSKYVKKREQEEAERFGKLWEK